MKSTLPFIAFLALVGFAIWQHTTISAQAERIASLTQEIERLRPRPKAPLVPSDLKKITCPLCHGEKVVVIRSGQNKLRTETQSCPVCLGVGYRMLKMLPAYKICPDCQGMGIVFYPEEAGQPIRHDNCRRCGATGLIADTK